MQGSGQGGYAGTRVGEASHPGPAPGTPVGGERARNSSRSPRGESRPSVLTGLEDAVAQLDFDDAMVGGTPTDHAQNTRRISNGPAISVMHIPTCAPCRRDSRLDDATG
eukprot:7594590-Karenia_brevis.AAC.1